MKQDGQNISKVFSGPAEFIAVAGKTSSYPLLFKPQWSGAFTGVLALSNYPMGEYNYNLKGLADEPLAEDSIP